MASRTGFDGDRRGSLGVAAVVWLLPRLMSRCFRASQEQSKSQLIPIANFVVSAIVGVAGLEATYEAVRAGKWVGLANKESLVAAGELITSEARRQGKPLLPIDSEHNAVHQCMRGGRLQEVAAVWLTASGGPFLNTPKSAVRFYHR